MTVYTAEAYMDELLARQDAYVAEHPPTPGREWVRPLLDWFVRAEDQVEGVTVNVAAPTRRPVAVKRDRRPEYQARLDRNRRRLQLVEERLAALTGTTAGDPAVVNLSPGARSRAAAAAGRRRMAALDRDIERTARLFTARDTLRHRIQLDEARLTRAEEEHRA